MEYRWQEAPVDSADELNAMAADGWEIIKEITSERNRTHYVLMERMVETIYERQDVVVKELELKLAPKLELKLIDMDGNEV